jgi:hypothetical protein
VVASTAASPLIVFSTMKSQKQDPYPNYDLEDWQWEFLRRNPRYIKAYKAVDWLKKRLDKKKKQVVRTATFNAFGVECSFRWIRTGDCEGEDEVWYERWVYQGSTHRTKTGKICKNYGAAGKVLELVSPDSNANEYKETLTRILATWLHKSFTAVAEIDKDMLREYLLSLHEIAVVIDTRHAPGDIVKEIKTLLEDYQSRKRHRPKLYPDYLAVWDLRREGLTDTQIAEELWPEEYETIGGRDDIGNKGSLMQRVHDHQKAAQKLIENSFPPKSRSPKIKK